MDFKIIDVYASSGHLVLTVEHYNADGSLWFIEHYTWQGREGVKRQRRVNVLGQPLLDDGTVPPSRIRPGPPDTVEYPLPAGRRWGYNDRPRLGHAQILRTIATIHAQRLASGWPQGTVDRLSTFKPNAADVAGISALLAHCRPLIGQAV